MQSSPANTLLDAAKQADLVRGLLLGPRYDFTQIEDRFLGYRGDLDYYLDGVVGSCFTVDSTGTISYERRNPRR